MDASPVPGASRKVPAPKLTAAERLERARLFLLDLSGNPPALAYDPTILPELFAGISSYSSSAGSLAAIIGRDQGLAAKVLAVANSACYGLESTVTSLDRAVAVLGTLELRSLALLFAVSASIPRKGLPKAFPGKALWEHQILAAQLGKAMGAAVLAARRRGDASAPLRQPGAEDGPDPEAIYTAALLHDIGKVFLAMRRPEDWALISELSSRIEFKRLEASGGVRRSCFAEAEDLYWGMDHATIGSMVLKQWSLPDLLTDMISWHHYPHLASQNKESVNIMAAANRLAVEGFDEAGNMPPDLFHFFANPAEIAPYQPALLEIMSSDRAGLLAGMVA